MGTAEALKRIALVTLVALPLIAFLVKTTSNDVIRYRAAFLERDAEEWDL
jgi:hypothetical protein